MQSSPSEPIWLGSDFVVHLNTIQVAATGEPHQLRDIGLLESALSAPSHLCAYDGERDILTLGIRLMLKIAQNHPFAQGNKRTAFISGVAFIEMNGFFVELPDMEMVADRFVDLTVGDMTEHEFRKFMRPFVRDPDTARKFWK